MLNAIRNARARSRNRAPFKSGMCLREVRECYGIPSAAPDAATAWRWAEHKHYETDPQKIPRGVPVFWSGGASGYGHVAISSTPKRLRRIRPARCWSTDIRRSGYFDRVPITEIHDRWGLTLLGWTEDLNGTYIGTGDTK